MTNYIAAIDQGTTSTRTVILNDKMQIISVSQQEFKQYYPHSGWVEHDTDEIWQTVITTFKKALNQANLQAGDITALGITNQRETVVLWDKKTGKAVHKAIVWQDRRSDEICQALKDEGHEALFNEKTGLLLDPYFSATKVKWLFDQDKSLFEQAKNGDLAFGTIDSWLIWRLSMGQSHVTDATNAARTMLYNISTGKWDEDIIDILNIPANILPEVKNCADDFGCVDESLFGAKIPIYGVAGDQQAATIGNSCFAPGSIKATYGTGCFALLNTGADLVRSDNRLLTTIAYQFDGKPVYALEGSIFVAGAAVQWLRDELKIIDNANETGDMAADSDKEQELYLVPAFTGLGAPHWDAKARGVLCGISRATGRNELARAALESVAYQTLDLIKAMEKDWPAMVETPTIMRVDGGLSASDWAMQFLADMVNAPVDRPEIIETTVLGAAYLAGLKAGIFPNPTEFSQSWKLNKRFAVSMDDGQRAKKYQGWQEAVARTLTS